MAMENKRIIQLNTERTTLAADDYVMVDSTTAGTAKYLLPKITDAIDQEISDRTSADTALQTAIANEATARTNADTTLQGNITAEAIARAAADTAINGEITQLKEDLDEYVINKYEAVNPSNWFNPETITDGELNKDGTVTASTTRFYTDYIPVIENSIVLQFRSNPINAIYRRHIACFDEDKNILPSVGSDNSSTGPYSLYLAPEVKYFRMTFDKNTLSLRPMIVQDGNTPTAYSQYFEPYQVLVEDFLTEESEQAVQKLVDKELTTVDIQNRYACALPKGYVLRQTVGLPQKWYYKNSVSPLTPVNISAGVAYGQRENNAIEFPNDTALNSVNGYTWNVYDWLMTLIEADGQNVPYGMDRHIIAENLQDCSVLVIGDSTVDFDTMTQHMLDYFTGKSKTLILLGTLGSGANRNEGRAGWKASDYLTNKQYEGVTNPFYNSTSGTFDFAYYMTNQGYTAPNFVVLQLGINDLYNYTETNIEPTWDAVKTMIDSIIAYNANIKVILNLPTAPNGDQAVHSVFLPLYQNRVVKYNQYAMKQALSAYGQGKVRPSYCHLILDPDTDIRDNVHPTDNGFKKMAYEVINQINCWQNGA